MSEFNCGASDDAVEVDRLSVSLKIMTRFRDEFEIKAERLEEENEKLRSELNDAIQSLKTISDLAGRDEFMRDIADVRQYARSRSIAANYMLSASAAPSARDELVERAEFEADWARRKQAEGCRERANAFYRIQPNDRYRWNDVQDGWDAWQARATLGRKP